MGQPKAKDDAIGPLTLTFDGHTYPIAPGESALDAFLRGGAPVRYSCRKGTCQTCALERVSGPIPAGAQQGLSASWVANDVFLPCLCYPTEPLEARPLDPTKAVRDAVLAEKERIGDVLRVRLEPPHEFSWRAGQTVVVRAPSGQARPFSIASIASEDYFIELHIRHNPAGAVSHWLESEAEPGSVVQIQGPSGELHYHAEWVHEPIILWGTGTGLGLLVGLAREALLGGHSGGISLTHFATPRDAAYQEHALAALGSWRDQLSITTYLREGAPSPGEFPSALPNDWDEARPELVLCGNPRFVAQARIDAVAAGFPQSAIHADPFTPFAAPGSKLVPPEDRQKLEATIPDPELWQALGAGELLAKILREFYATVYADSRLAPFFHRVTMDWAIEKQFSFLRDVFSGTKHYFGSKPYNSHHWMVISDDLFDYREKLFFDVVGRHGLPKHLMRRWAAFHEQFRAELVKAEPRGLFVNGEENVVPPFTDELLSVATLCDGCSAEMAPGSTGRLLERTGQLFCLSCSASSKSG